MKLQLFLLALLLASTTGCERPAHDQTDFVLHASRCYANSFEVRICHDFPEDNYWLASTGECFSGHCCLYTDCDSVVRSMHMTQADAMRKLGWK